MFLGLTSTSATEIASGKFSHGQLAPDRILVRFVLYYLCGTVACIVRDVLGPVGEGIRDYITGLLLFPPSLPCLRRSAIKQTWFPYVGTRKFHSKIYVDMLVKRKHTDAIQHMTSIAVPTASESLNCIRL